MKKIVQFFGLILAIFAVFQTQSVTAVNYAAYLPGVASTATTNTTSYITVPGASLKTQITSLPFTVEMAFFPTAYNNYGGLWCDRSQTTICNLQYASGVNYLRLDYGGTASVLTLTNAIPVLNQWNHVALVISSDSIKLELNGTWYRMAKANTAVPFTGTSYIGCDYGGAVSRTIAGQFDHIRFWNTKRAEADIAANKFTTLTGTETGLVANYNFDGQNTNDVTPNGFNATAATGVTYTNLTTLADLSNITLNAGVLTSDFSAATTTYSAIVPPTTPNPIVTGIPASYLTTIGNNNATINATNTSAALVATANDGVTSKTYTVNYLSTSMADWSADGATGNRSYPNLWGWNCSDSPGAWGLANGSNCRLLDITSGWFFNSPTAWTGRALYIRWDGTGATTANSVFSYPVSVVSGQSYTFTYKYAWANNATLPTLTYGFATDIKGLNMVVADTAMTSNLKQNFKSKSLTFTATTSGVYYLFIKSSTAALCGIADLALVADNTTQNITSSVSSLSFDNLNQTKTFIIGGANLTGSNITLTPPAGVTLSKTTVTIAEALAGATITATYDNATNILGGLLTYTNGTISKSIAITGSADGSCFTQLYPGLTNLIIDPYLNSLSSYGGWGTKSIVSDPTKAYCGLNCAIVGNTTAKNTGSLDFYPAAGVMLAKTTYRLHAMIKTVGTGLSMQFGIAGCGIGGVTTDFTSLVTTNGSWAPFDLTFTTGTLAATQDIYFNNSNATTPAFSGYIDNYELYAVPAIYAPATLSFLGAGSQTMVIRGVSFTDNITITAPTGYTVTPSTFVPSPTGTTVTVTFNSATSISGNLSVTNAAGTVAQSVAVTGTMAATIVASPTALVLDDLNTTGSFTVTGGNLLSDIAITAPAGITVNPTSIPKGSASGVTVAVTYDGTTSNVGGNIALTSGTLVTNVAVTATKNSDCFTPLYSTLTDLIPNPQMNDISGFGGWGTGTRSVVFGQAYCGAACVMFSTTTNAYPTGDDLDLTNIAWAANSTYRLHAWVKAVDGTFAFLANGTNPDVTISVPQSNNVWELIDQTFTTGASPTTGFFTFNNLDGASTGKIAYLDNYELYNITSTVITKNDNLADNQSLKVYIKGDKIVADFSLSEASNVEFTVYNIQGLLISNVKEASVAGQNQIVINANLPSGVYLVKMFNKGQSFTTKLIK